MRYAAAAAVHQSAACWLLAAAAAQLPGLRMQRPLLSSPTQLLLIYILQGVGYATVIVQRPGRSTLHGSAARAFFQLARSAAARCAQWARPCQRSRSAAQAGAASS